MILLRSPVTATTPTAALPRRPAADAPSTGRLARAGLMAMALALLTIAVLGGAQLAGWLGHGAGAVAAAVGTGLVLVTRLALWWRYRPMTATAAELQDLPTLTVVIPAFNEGAAVRRAIGSVLASRYPQDRLRLIVVNDGSTDDTGAHVDACAAEAGGRVEVVHLPRNRGKRHALYEGFRRARSEVIATVDSDSEVAPDALAQLVTPLTRDPAVGGVAGKVTVHNRKQSWLTRMLGVRYILGFDFVRAYQSELRTVWCCPGALQAYRRALVAPHLDAWRDQRFLGAACTNGDDHAMTNLVLSLGADTTYQANAEVRTLVPATYRRLCKMYVRWGRSATREGLRALAFTPARARRKGGLTGALVALDALLQPVGLALRILTAFAAAWLLITHPLALAKTAAVALAFAALYALVYLRSERSLEVVFGFAYALFALVALPWVQPFATLTVRRNGWLTRG